VLFASSRRQALDISFDVAPDTLQLLYDSNTRRTHAFVGTTQNKSRVIAEHNTNEWTLLRFCDACRAYNIDPLCPVSVHLMWILSSKCHRKADLLQKFAHATSHNDAVAGLDWEAADVTKPLETNDWVAILQYTNIVAPSPNAEPGVLLRRLSDCWSKSKLDEEYEPTPLLLMHIFSYIMLEHVPAQKILELKLGMLRRQQGRSVCRDLELRCLRCVASFNNDMHTEEATIADSMLSLTCMQINPELSGELVSVLKLQETRAEAHDVETRRTVGRMQLRSLAKKLHQSKQWVYSATFDAWAVKQQFSVTTTRRQQLLMYFLMAQSRPASPEKLQVIFSTGMLKRMDAQSLDHIDANAILSMLQSIRLYANNIAALVDFRMQCLAGVSYTLRKTLSMAQILQLYIACFQHPTIQEHCWRGVLPVWNYTIRDSCERFVRNNTYEIDAVLDSIIACMLETDRVNETEPADPVV